MEVGTTSTQTELQRNDKEFARFAARIRSIGRLYVAEASGYNDQSISNYLTRKYGSEKMELAIKESLPRAIELKKQNRLKAHREAIIVAQGSVKSILEDTQRELLELQEELEKSSFFSDQV